MSIKSSMPEMNRLDERCKLTCVAEPVAYIICHQSAGYLRYETLMVVEVEAMEKFRCSSAFPYGLQICERIEKDAKLLMSS